MSERPIDRFLSRVDGVRSTGPGRWIARSPVREDSTPSLSIREGDDGRVLLHDFGGGAAAEIVAALGLELRDLFPDRDRPATYAPSRSGRRVPAEDLLAMLDREATTVAAVGARMLERRSITPEEWEALAVAITRIGVIRERRRLAA